MTTGNVVYDSTIAYPTPANANSRWGIKYTKNWSGADRPKTPPVYKILRNPKNGKFYRKRVRTVRHDTPHSYSMTLEQWSMPVWGHWEGTISKRYYESIIPYGGAIPAWGSSPWTSNDDIALLAKLHERIYGTGFNPAVFLAESGQTLGMIGEAACRIAQSLSYLRKGNLREASRVITQYTRHRSRGPRADRALAQNVLEVQYGWRPLMSDMVEGAEWLAHTLHAPVSFKVSARRQVVKNVNPNGNGVSEMMYASCSRMARKQIIAYLSEPPHNAVLQSLLHPEEVIWEKLPWSFVCDWALPIGNYLRARGIASTLQGTFVTTSKEVLEGEGGVPTYLGSVQYTKIYKYVNLSGIDSFYRKVILSRAISTSLNAPLPVFKGFGSTFSWEHCLNGVSLLATASSKNPDDVLKGCRDWLSRRR